MGSAERVGALANRHHRGLVEDDALSFDTDQGITRTQVDAHIHAEEAVRAIYGATSVSCPHGCTAGIIYSLRERKSRAGKGVDAFEVVAW